MSARFREVLRYVVNGLAATLVHYGALSFNLAVLDIPSAGLANFLAAIVGITASFLGSRYFVFRKTEEPILRQMVKFGGLYGAIALLHGLVLLVWTDFLGHDFRIGFVIATAMQVSLSYAGNRFLVFVR
ncbi:MULTISPECIES: GtrA family protein [Nitratireductor]|uniref:GtrA family protein n=1 Tax=Nitratireductor TaxID=245876 RepID=UPI000D0D5ECE|nr:MULTISPECIES: GtrA family protein [Nitratireductor]PSM19729.1 GtrA family protein [Nitratireductor sp. StC3]